MPPKRAFAPLPNARATELFEAVFAVALPVNREPSIVTPPTEAMELSPPASTTVLLVVVESNRWPLTSPCADAVPGNRPASIATVRIDANELVFRMRDMVILLQVKVGY